MASSIWGRPGGDLVLEGASSGPVLRIPPAGGASMAGRLTSSGGVTITGGQGRHGMGAQLRLVSSGDLVYNTAALNFGGLGQDLHSVELSCQVRTLPAP